MAIAPTLLAGSQVALEFTTMPFVEPLFLRGFTQTPKLKAAYLPTENSIRFWISDTAGDMLTQVSSDSVFAVPSTPYSSNLNTYSVIAYSRAGAVCLMRINPNASGYAAFVQTATAPLARIEQSLTETLSINFAATSPLATVYSSTVNRDTGVSLFDNAYWSSFNRSVSVAAPITGLVPLVTSGFSIGNSWMKQTVDVGTGDIYVAVASNSATGIDADLGTPVMIVKNDGTVGSPVYVVPPNALINLPDTKYQFTATSYTSATDASSPYPYIVAVAQDGSAFVFTVIVALVNKTYAGTVALTFDFSPSYLRRYMSASGLGGALTTQLQPPPVNALPMSKITGVRVIGLGGLVSLSDITLKQRTNSPTGVPLVQGLYPAVDPDRYTYLSASGDGVNFGAEVLATASGVYTLYTTNGGTVAVTTNRLLYDPYYNGVEVVKYNYSAYSLLDQATASKLLLGDIEYKCFFLVNTHPTQTITTLKLWSDYNCDYLTGSTANDNYIQMGIITNDRDGTANPTIANQTTAPVGITFAFHNSELEAAVVSTLLPGECVPIWVKRVIKSGQVPSGLPENITSSLRLKLTY